MHQRDGNIHAPPHPARERFHGVVNATCQANEIQKVAEPRGNIAGAHSHQRSEGGEVFTWRQSFIESDLLRHESDGPPRTTAARWIFACYPDATARPRHSARQRPDKGGFAGAVRTEQCKNFAGAN